MKMKRVIDVEMFGNKKLISYYKVLSPCIQQLRKVVFPEGKWWSREDQKPHSQIRSVLQETRKDLTSALLGQGLVFNDKIAAEQDARPTQFW